MMKKTNMRNSFQIPCSVDDQILVRFRCSSCPRPPPFTVSRTACWCSLGRYVDRYPPSTTEDSLVALYLVSLSFPRARFSSSLTTSRRMRWRTSARARWALLAVPMFGVRPPTLCRWSAAQHSVVSQRVVSEGVAASPSLGLSTCVARAPVIVHGSSTTRTPPS